MNGAFSDGFLDAVIDTLLPGEAESASGSPLPAATGAGLAGRDYGERHAAVLTAIHAEAVSDRAFVTAPPAERHRILAEVEKRAFEPFRALVQEVAADYHDQPAVLRAFGWRSEPPQPGGHRIEPADGATAARLARVAARGQIFRVVP